MRLDGNVNQLLMHGHPAGVLRGFKRIGSDERDDRTEFARADLPYVQVDDARVATFNRCSDLLLEVLIADGVDQNSAGVAQQSPRPTADHQRAHNSHGRVHPRPTEESSGEKGANGKH